MELKVGRSILILISLLSIQSDWDIFGGFCLLYHGWGDINLLWLNRKKITDRDEDSNCDDGWWRDKGSLRAREQEKRELSTLISMRITALIVKIGSVWKIILY